MKEHKIKEIKFQKVYMQLSFTGYKTGEKNE